MQRRVIQHSSHSPADGMTYLSQLVDEFAVLLREYSTGVVLDHRLVERVLQRRQYLQRTYNFPLVCHRSVRSGGCNTIIFYYANIMLNTYYYVGPDPAPSK